MTVIDICNMALSSLGHQRAITGLSDATAEARLCAAWLETARRGVLSAAFWQGLTRFTGPDDGAPDEASGGEFFRYWMPGCGHWLRAEAYAEDGSPADIARTDANSLLLREPRASFRVVRDEEDPEAWPHDVRTAVALALAAAVALALTGQKSAAAEARERAAAALSAARERCANLTRRHGEENRYAAARRGEGWN